MELLKALAESLYAAAATDTSSSKACANLIARAMYSLSSIIRLTYLTEDRRGRAKTFPGSPQPFPRRILTMLRFRIGPNHIHIL